MSTRKILFQTGKYYHIYNRGVEKRNITTDKYDVLRFLKGLQIFNTTESIGSIFEFDKRKDNQAKNQISNLVQINAFNLLGNHYHLIVKQIVDGGISKYMQSVNGGYTKYFNEKYDRVGSLFQGPYKAAYINDDIKLNKLLAYVNLNHVVHKVGTPTSNSSSLHVESNSLAKYTSDKDGVVKCKIPSVSDIKPNNTYLRSAMEIVDEIIEMRTEIDTIEKI